MKNLENYQVLELSKEQLKMVSGGWLWKAIGIAIAAWDAVNGFVEGMKEAYEE